MANKVGTVGLALAALAAGIQLVVVGPVSTIDLACPEGGRIVIEERGEDEVRTVAGRPLTLAERAAETRPSTSPQPRSSGRWLPSGVW